MAADHCREQCNVLFMTPAQAIEVVDGWTLPRPEVADGSPQVAPATGMEGVGLRLAMTRPPEAGPTPYQMLLLGIPVSPERVAGPSRAEFLATLANARSLVGGPPAPGGPNPLQGLDPSRHTAGSRRRFYYLCQFFLTFRNSILAGRPMDEAFQTAKGWLFALIFP